MANLHRISGALAAVAALLFSVSGQAELITVTPSDDYTKIEGAQAGDIVEIQPGTYKFRVFLSAQGTASEPIIIRAADPSDRPVWDLDGNNVESWPGSYTGGDNGRGCWQVGGAHYQISGIIFRNCHTSSNNAPGIRARAAEHLLVRDVLVEDSDDGFTGEGEPFTAEFCELRNNGHATDPPQHNVYIYGGAFNLRYSYIHDSAGGQNLHIRARESVIEYNWIARAQNYEADMMDGGDAQQSMLFRGNVMVGRDDPENGSKLFAMYTGQALDLKLLYNTFVVNAGSNPAVVAVHNDSFTSANVVMANNIVVGTDKAFSVDNSGNANYTLGGSHNWFETGADIGPLTDTIFGAEPGFADGPGLDLTLASGSPAIGAASAGAEAPDREYFESQTNPMMFRWRTSVNDLGAFESTTAGNGYGPYDDPGQPPQGGSGPGGGSTGGSSTGGSATGAGGSGAAGGTTAGAADSEEDSGCGCVLPGAPERSLPVGFAAFAGFALALVRSRRKR